MVDTSELQLKCLQQIQAHSEAVWYCVWNPAGDLLATCSGDKTIKIWGQKENNGPLECKSTLSDEHTRTIRSMIWSHDGKMLISVGFDSKMSVWLKKEDGFDCVATMEGHDNEIKSVDFDSSGTYLATCGRDKTVWIWDKDVDEDEDYEWACNSILNGHSQDVKKVRWIPDTETLVSASYDDTIKFWNKDDDDDWVCTATISDHESTVWCIEFTSDGNFMASCSDDKTIKIYQKNEDANAKVPYQLISNLQGYHDRAIYCCSWNQDDTLLVTVSRDMKYHASGQAGGDDKMCIFEKKEPGSGDSLPSFELVASKDNSHFSDVNCVAFHPQRNLIASVGDDNFLKIWSIGN